MVVVGNGGLTQKQFCVQYGWIRHGGGSHISMIIHGLQGRIQGGAQDARAPPSAPGPYHIKLLAHWHLAKPEY